MGKKKSWFSLVKRLFIWDTHSTQEKEERRRKWIFGRLRSKRLASITAPLPTKETTLSESEEEQGKHALTVAIASAAAAEAAVTAAHAAAEVVRLTGDSQSSLQRRENSEESQPVQNMDGVPQSIYQCQMEIKESTAAIKIQTAFRGYLMSWSKPFSLDCVTLRPLCIIFSFTAEFPLMDSE